jgi:hypothetical protein
MSMSRVNVNLFLVAISASSVVIVGTCVASFWAILLRRVRHETRDIEDIANLPTGTSRY